MDKIWWFGVAVLVLAFCAFIAEIVSAYRRPSVNVDDRNWNASLSDGFGDIPIEDRVFPCCDHCFGNAGEYTHSREEMDMHTVPCNEKSFKHEGDCQDEGDYIR